MVQDNVRLEDVTIGYGSYRNFSGNKTEYNKAGERKFSGICFVMGRMLRDY